MNKTFAIAVSVAGHPLLVLTYVLLLMLAIDPFQFGARHFGETRAVVLLISVFSISFLIPAIGIAMMKPLGLIKSLDMPDKQERIGPYIVAGVFYLWLFKNLLSGGQSPPLLTQFTLGATLGLFLAFFINIFTKISAHAVGMGGFVAMLLILTYQWGRMPLVLGGGIMLSMFVVLLAGVVLAGLTGMARLALGAHTPADLYRGYFTGMASVVIAQMLL